MDIFYKKNAENLTLIPENVKDEGLKEAYIEANQQNWTKLELEDYLRASIKERDEIGRIEFAEKKAEKKAILKIAKNLKENGVPLELIIKSTGLTKDVIEKI